MPTPWSSTSVTVILVLILLLDPKSAVAQRSGQAIGQSTGLLDKLTELAITPPRDFFSFSLTPFYVGERYESYTEPATLTRGIELPANILGPAEVEIPGSDVDTFGIDAVLEYRFPAGYLLGGTLRYANSEYDYSVPSLAESQAEVPTGTAFLGSQAFGDPIGKSIEEFGASVHGAYLPGDWTFLLRIGGIHREIDEERREFENKAQLGVADSEFDSDLWFSEVGLSFKWAYGSFAITPNLLLRYQREKIAGYSEEQSAAFADENGSDCVLRGSCSGNFQRQSNPPFTVARKFNEQTIESIPLRIGVLGSAAIDAYVDEDDRYGLQSVVLGPTYTHDFADQERLVTAEPIGENLADLTVVYTETNRNRNFISVTAAANGILGPLQTTLTYQRDVGLDEKISADIVRLQLLAQF